MKESNYSQKGESLVCQWKGEPHISMERGEINRASSVLDFG